MSRLGIFVDRRTLSSAEQLHALIRCRDAAESLGHSTEFLFPVDIKKIPQMDGPVFIRARTDPLNVTYIASRMAESCGIPVIDDPASIRICSDKVNMYSHLLRKGIAGNAPPFGRLDEPAITELARQRDIAGAVDLLAQWRLPYAPALRQAYPGYRDRNDLLVLETALDRGFFAAALRSLDADRPDDAVVAGHLRREIDLILVGYALRAMHHGAPPAEIDEVFLPGGRTITREVRQRPLASDRSERPAAAVQRSRR